MSEGPGRACAPRSAASAAWRLAAALTTLASATASADRAPPVPCPPSEGSGRACAPRSAASAAWRLAAASTASASGRIKVELFWRFRPSLAQLEANWAAATFEIPAEAPRLVENGVYPV